MIKKNFILLSLFLISGCMAEKPVPVKSSSVLPGEQSSPVFVEQSLPVLGKATPEEGLEMQYKGVRLIIPPGAVEETVEISMDFVTQHKGFKFIQNANGGRRGILRLEPSMEFLKPVTIESSYDKSFDDKKDQLYTWFWREDGGFWERIERVGIDPTRRLLVSKTNHFSDFINSTLELPESPEVSSMDETSLKNLEASKGDAGMPEPLNIKAGNKGAEGVNIPLKVPGGAGGMQPSLAVRWIKEGNTWLGQGFDLTVSSMGIDGRYGLPDYDYTADEMRYTLDGEILEKGTAVGIENGESYIEYLPQRERGSFQRIRRFGTGKECWFEVTAKNGRKRFFGKPDAQGQTGSRELGWEGYTFRWYLSEERDIHGNWIRYQYREDSGQVYPETITWGAAGNNTALYRVRFIPVDPNISPRNDVVVSGRSRVLTKQRLLLDSVVVENLIGEPTAIRTYSFEYYGVELFAHYVFGKSYLKRISEYDSSGKELYGYDFTYQDLEHFDQSLQSFKLFEYSPRLLLENSENYNLGKSQTSSFTMGFGTGAGGGLQFTWGTPIIKINLSGGGNMTFNNQQTSNTIQDLDGNGLPDLVHFGSGLVSIKENPGFYLQEDRGIYSAGLTDDKIINGLIGAHLNSEGRNYSGTFGISANSIYVGGNTSMNMNNGSNTSNTMFTDINADGFCDYVDGNGFVFLQKESGVYELSPDVLNFNRELSLLEKQVKESREKEIYNLYQLRDPLVKWVAPYSGKIKIRNTAEFLSEGVDDEDYTLSVFHNNTQKGASCSLSEMNDFKTWEVDEFSVSKGDCLYFLTSASFDPFKSSVRWNRVIEYTDTLSYYERAGEFTFDALPQVIPYNNSFTNSSYTTSLFMDPDSPPSFRMPGKNLVSLTPRKIRELHRELEKYSFPPLFAHFQPFPEEQIEKNETLEILDEVYTLEEGIYRLDLTNDFFNSLKELTSLESYNSQELKIYMDKLSRLSGFFATLSTEEFTGRFYQDSEGQTLPVYQDDGEYTIYTGLYPEKEMEIQSSSDVRNFIWNGTVFSLGEEDSFLDLEGEKYCSLEEEETFEVAGPGTFDTAFNLLNLPDGFNQEGIFTPNSESLDNSIYLREQLGLIEEARDIVYFVETADGQKEFTVHFSGNDISTVNDASGKPQNQFCTLEHEDNEYEHLDDCYTMNQFYAEFPDLESLPLESDSFYYNCSGDILKSRENELFLLDKGELNWISLEKPQLMLLHSTGLQNESLTFLVEQRGVKGVIHYAGRKLNTQKNLMGNNEEGVGYYLTSEGLKSFTVDNIIYDSYNDFSIDQVDPVDEYSALYARTENFSGGYRNWYYAHINHLENHEDFNEDLLVFKIPELVGIQNVSDINTLVNASEEERTQKVKDLTHQSEEGDIEDLGIERKTMELPFFQVYDPCGVEPRILEGNVYKKQNDGTVVIDDEDSKNKQEIINYTGKEGWYIRTAEHNGSAVFNGIQEKDIINPERLGIFLHLDEFQVLYPEALTFSKTSSMTTNLGLSFAFNPCNPSTSPISQSYNSSLKSVMSLDGRNVPTVVETVNDLWTSRQIFDSFIPEYSKKGVYKTEIVGNISGPLSQSVSIGESLSVGISKASTPPSPSQLKAAMRGGSGNPSLTAASGVNPIFLPSFGVANGQGTAFTLRKIMDLNGDGLTDVLDSSGGMSTVQYNMGGYFSQPTPLIVDSIDKSNNKNASYNLGLNVGVGTTFVSFCSSGHVGGGEGDDSVESSLVDMNGDGLPDRIFQAGDKLLISFNTGENFSIPVPFQMPSSEPFQSNISGNTSWGGGLAVNGILPVFQFGPIPVQITVDISFSNNLSWSTNCSSTKSRLIPFSGNGASDLVVSTVSFDGDSPETFARGLNPNSMGFRKPLPTESLYMYINTLSRVGLLSSITTPRGTVIDLEYTRVGHTRQNPQGRWEVSAVTVQDPYREQLYSPGYKNGYVFRKEFNYSNGYYDRKMKMFYGYETVTTKEISTEGREGKISINTYFNSQYHTAGLLMETVVLDREGLLLKEENCHYATVTRSGRDTTLLSSKESVSCDISGNRLTSLEKYTYDSYGNPESYTLSREGMNPLFMSLDYNTDSVRWLLSQLTDIEVYSRSGGRYITYRKQVREYNAQTGQVEKIIQYNGQKTSETSYGYNDQGHLNHVETPSGYSVNVEYDRYGLFPLSTTDSLGLSTEQTWNYAHQVPLTSVDSNGSLFSYVYDAQGRLVELRTPYDTGLVPYMKVEYSPRTPSKPYWKAVTHTRINKSPDDTATISTATLTDALGRTFQVQKDARVYNSDREESESGVIVSSFIEYDSWGQQKRVYEPFFRKNIGEAFYDYYRAPQLDNPYGDFYYTENYFNSRGEVIRTQLPDKINSISTETVFSGTDIRKSVTDPSGLVVDSYSNLAGQTLRIVKHSLEYGDIETEYIYDDLGQLLKVRDTDGNETVMTYDNLGQKLSVSSPAGGLLQWQYNKAGQVVSHQNPVLRDQQEKIVYEYDQTRLIKVDYPEKTDMVYTYGDDPEAFNLGRLVKVEGEFGSEEYTYGIMGEMLEETHTFKYKTEAVEKVFKTSREYNYLGQLTHQENFDGRETDYIYDNVGQVTGISTGRNGYYQDIVSDAGYNLYGQRAFLEFGNGTTTTYEYDPARRWMESFRIDSDYKGTLQNMVYEFDDCVGNVSRFTKTGRDPIGYDGVQFHDYTITQEFEYDSLHQLTRGTGTYDQPNNSFYHKQTYTQDFSYDTLGRMQAKRSTHTKELGTGEIRSIFDFELNYDFDYQYDDRWVYRATRIGEQFYQYDANGNTAAVSPESFNSPETHGETPPGITSWNDNTFVMQGLLHQSQEQPQDQTLTEAYTWDEENKLKESKTTGYHCYYRYGPDGERMYKRTNDREQNFYIDENQQYYIQNEPGFNQTITSHFYIAGQRVASLVQKGFTSEYDAQTEETTYWYHPDHLGTASLITDHEGLPYERLEYTPFGEVWNKETDDAILNYIEFGFTGQKEDKETGLLAFPQRYYNARTSRWLSPDPMGAGLMVSDPGSIQSQNWFSYCNNNPIMFVDPEGLFIYGLNGVGQQQNVGRNRTAQIGSVPSEKFWNTDFRKGMFTNDVGKEGCLFVSSINIANAYNSRQKVPSLGYAKNWQYHSAADLAGNDDYFYFKTVLSKVTIKNSTSNVMDLVNNPSMDLYFPGVDFGSDTAELQTLMKDITGIDWSITGKTGDEARDYIKTMAADLEDGAYIVAKVDGHYFNVTGYDDVTGKFEFYDVYKWNKPEMHQHELNDVGEILIYKPAAGGE